MYWLRRAGICLTLLVVLSFTAWVVPRVLDPTGPDPEKRARDRQWVRSSPYFVDRQLCRWVSLCGLHHLRKDPAAGYGLGGGDNDGWDEADKIRGELRRRSPSWEDGAPPLDPKRNVHHRRRVLKEVPDFVGRYAPLVHLYSGEEFYPSDIKEHVEHMTVFVDHEPLNTTDEEWTLHNLHRLNEFGDQVTLWSNDDVESRPGWLHSHHNIPGPFEEDPEDHTGKKGPERHRGDDGSVRGGRSTTWYDVDKDHPLHRISDPRRRGSSSDKARRLHPRGHKPDANGYSRAPSVLILVDKGSGILDAFWFFFYSYNLGQTVFGVRFGNNVGDWEHCMVRFEHGEPRGIYFSEHEGGQAYAWEAVEKSKDGRPIIYSATGSHAMYPLSGPHPYIIPFDLLRDVTDKGPLWDPNLNKYSYHYDYEEEEPFPGDPEDDEAVPKPLDADGQPYSLVPAAENPTAPTSWFHFQGRWGDELYSLADMRQWRLFGQYHYVTGPAGPKFKSLNRSTMCKAAKCNIAYDLDPGRTWY